MNINIIQTLQISQNAVSATDRGGSNTVRMSEPSSAVLSSEDKLSRSAEPGLTTATGLLKAQLDELTTNYPPFFPVGSYQRPDLIRRIRTLEEQVGGSTTDENVRQMFSREKLNDMATDTEIAASLDRLLAVRDKLGQNKDLSLETVKPGSLIEITA